MTRRLTYLPALDGLRAIAVVMVFAYHLGFSWASGGFLGVDLFFVISGYLITRLLLDEHADGGRIDLGSFWTRRFRRLVPVMVVMIAATLVATHRWGLPEQWRSVRGDALAALGYVANWRFVLDDQSYFEASIGPSPLLHTWSLAVEEQWYLLWPIAMVGLCWWVARSPSARRWAAAVVLIAAAASALWMAVLFDADNPSRVYYGTDTRAQQLLVGAALAWLLDTTPALRTWATASSARLPFAVAIAAFVTFGAMVQDDSSWLYRGGLLAVSVLAAVVVLGTTAGPGSGLAWLGASPLVWIGRRSYGIYLWHWPVILFMDPATGGNVGRWPLVGLQIAVTLVAAEMSYRLIEAPVRRSSSHPVRTVAVWSGAGAGVAVAGLVWLVPPTDRDLGRSDAAFVDLESLEDLDRDTPPSGSGSTVSPSDSAGEDGADGVQIDGETRAASETRRLLMFGDSAANTLARQLELSPDSRWDVQTFAAVGCPITPGLALDEQSSEPIPLSDACPNDWVSVWPDYARALEPDIVVIMIGAWEVLDHRVDGTDIRFPSAQWNSLISTALVDAVESASASGAPVVVLDVPCMQGQPDTMARADPDRVAELNDLIRQTIERAGSTDTESPVTVAEVSEVICPGGANDLTTDGVPVRYDGVHYTRAGAALVWPWLLDELDGILDEIDGSMPS